MHQAPQQAWLMICHSNWMSQANKANIALTHTTNKGLSEVSDSPFNFRRGVQGDSAEATV